MKDGDSIGLKDETIKGAWRVRYVFGLGVEQGSCPRVGGLDFGSKAINKTQREKPCNLKPPTHQTKD